MAGSNPFIDQSLETAGRFVNNLGAGANAMFGPQSPAGQTIQGAVNTVANPGQAVVGAFTGLGQGMETGIRGLGRDMRETYDAAVDPNLDPYTKGARVAGKLVNTARDAAFLPASALGGAMQNVPVTKPVADIIGQGISFIDKQLNNLYGTEDKSGAWQEAIDKIPDPTTKGVLTSLATFMRETGKPVAKTAVQGVALRELTKGIKNLITKSGGKVEVHPTSPKDIMALQKSLDKAVNKYTHDANTPNLIQNLKSVEDVRGFLDKRFKDSGFTTKKANGEYYVPDSTVVKNMQDYQKLLATITERKDPLESPIFQAVKKTKEAPRTGGFSEAGELFKIKDPSKPTFNGVPRALVPFAKPLRAYETVKGFIKDLKENNVKGLPYYQSKFPETQLRLFDRLNEFTGQKYDSAGAFYSAVKLPTARVDVKMFKDPKGNVFDLNARTIKK